LKKILLTGGAGFIGKNYIQQSLVNKKAQVFSPTRQELDLQNTKEIDAYFQNKQFDTIIHAASVDVSRNKSVESLLSLNDNLRMFCNVFKNYPNHGRFIQLGSGAEYGRPLRIKEIDESYLGRSIPEDSYGFSKLLASQIIEKLSPAKAVSLQLFGIFGPYEDYQCRFISNAIVRALFGMPILVLRNAEFNYMYIKDFLRILDYFVEIPAEFSCYNITNGAPITLVEISTIVRDVLGNRHKIEVKNSNINTRYTGSNKRLISFLPKDFKFTLLRDAIEEMVVWYEKRLDSLDRSLAENTF
jgi:UDP-glucose 4-epimerase